MNMHSLPFGDRAFYFQLRHIFQFFAAPHPDEDALWLQDRWNRIMDAIDHFTSAAGYIPEHALVSVLDFCHANLPASVPYLPFVCSSDRTSDCPGRCLERTAV